MTSPINKGFNYISKYFFLQNNFGIKRLNKYLLILRLCSTQELTLLNQVYVKKNDAINSDRQIIKYCQDSQIIYNSYIEKYKFKGSKLFKKKLESQILLKRKENSYKASIPHVVENFNKTNLVKQDKNSEKIDVLQEQDSSEHFPFTKFEISNLEDVSYDESDSYKVQSEIGEGFSDKNISVSEDISTRLKVYNEKKLKGEENFLQIKKHPEDDDELKLRFYEDTLLTELTLDHVEIQSYVNQHGTPDPTVPKSSIPCGGCGAILHCQDEGLPGYMPSEAFKGKSKSELKSLSCQRCFFLQTHNAALNVKVSPAVYEDVLRPIKDKKSLIIVVIDLIDTPCSIWPRLCDLIGKQQPVIVIGNKVDLLPLDNPKYLRTIKASLIESLKGTSLWKTSIRHVCLVSAKTGFGIESLITHIQTKWGIQGDIYILGCTNAGKSTLFNTLLRSDMCKIRASNLIQRATASPWPGTTLNLLKFPLFRPTGHRLAARRIRLRNEEIKMKEESASAPPRSTSERRLASLKGYIGQTFYDSSTVVDFADPFKIIPQKIPKDTLPQLGINENAPEYLMSKWCYDTPGTVQPDQFLGLLTHDELLDVLPRKMIEPKAFVLHSSDSLFVAGIARFDLVYCPHFVRVVVCCSDNLPITICRTSEASALYRTYLGTTLLRVPRGIEQRLSSWSALKPTNVRLVGKGRETAADVVLSSAGFVSVIGKEDFEIDLRCWTPGGRGVYIRSPSMLPNAINLIGKRIKGSPTYRKREMTALYSA